MRRISNSTSAEATVIYNLSPSDQVVRHTMSTDSASPTPKVEIAGGHSIRQQRNIQNAIYGHIRALRSLGRTSINTLEIAQALSLPLREVHSALVSLKKKGVMAL